LKNSFRGNEKLKRKEKSREKEHRSNGKQQGGVLL
jgi:hypothetical protein